MLDYLHIENIAVIETANIDFKTGFNVMTGETGAGKSIIIDAIFALLGERTSRELIRHGADKAVVSASFSDVGKSAEDKLSGLGFFLDEGKVIIQRVLFADGRGQVKINGAPANVSTLKEIGKYLINVHGQHDSQTLLNPASHITFIDAFAENLNERREYTEAFENFKRISKELNSITTDEEEKLRRKNYLKHQIDEIEKADVKIGETEKIKEFLSRQQNSAKITEALKVSASAISGDGDDVFSAVDSLKIAKNSLVGLENVFSGIKSTIEALDTAISESESAYFSIKSYLDEVEIDPIKTEEYQNRLDILRNIMLKYGGSEEKVLENYKTAAEELETIEFSDQRRVELEELLDKAQSQLIEKGKKLTASRKMAAEEICKRICDELNFLDFSGAKFTAEIKSGKYTKNGCDTTEFLISANAGEEPKSLAKIASGGELSRIMLAIRSVLSLKDDVETLIFDEIDSGISGHAAGKVAVKLYDVAKNRQVICVTHLAQIASYADLHLYISKYSENNKTFTNVTPLDFNGRVREIARIISGDEYTENLMKTAEEMINLSKENSKRRSTNDTF